MRDGVYAVRCTNDQKQTATAAAQTNQIIRGIFIICRIYNQGQTWFGPVCTSTNEPNYCLIRMVSNGGMTALLVIPSSVRLAGVI